MTTTAIPAGRIVHSELLPGARNWSFIAAAFATLMIGSSAMISWLNDNPVGKTLAWVCAGLLGVLLLLLDAE